MRKVLFSVLALALFCGSAMAADSIVKVKGGLDLLGKINVEYSGQSGTEDTKTGINLAGEYLYQLNEIVRVGGGIEYLAPRKINNIPINLEFNFIPVYLTIEINPIEAVKELYFKGNLGYNLLFDYDFGSNEEGGIYFGLGAAYEFDFGLFVEGIYSKYYGSAKDPLGTEGDINYGKLGLNVGYKFDF